jgi:hypothetical protein
MEEVACTLNGSSMGERRERWHRLARSSFVERTETADGLTLAFRDDPGVEVELAELAGLERDCCAFASWSVARRGGELELRVAAPSDEGVAALHGMFRSLASGA